MKSNEVLERFNELNNNNNLCCTPSELESFLVSGLIFKSGDKYITRNFSQVSVTILEPKELTFDIDFNAVISICEEQIKKVPTNKIYCMNTRCYNKYKEDGFIIVKDNQQYFRLFDKELWLIYLID